MTEKEELAYAMFCAYCKYEGTADDCMPRWDEVAEYVQKSYFVEIDAVIAWLFEKGYLSQAGLKFVGQWEDDLYPAELQEKLKRIGWGGWVPTGVTDEDTFLYITLGNRHIRVMSHEQALALEDTELQRQIEQAIGMTYREACEQYGLAPDEITAKGGKNYQ